MVNCNPETVSTDYDTSDRLYFEPLTLEDVLGDRRGRAAGGRDRAVRRPDAAKLAAGLEAAGRAAARHAAVEAIDLAEDRGRFGALLAELGLERAAVRDARTSAEEALAAAPGIGYPLLVRPSYVLGGRAMEIVYDVDGLRDYLRAA